jgi:hypothetical protein|tara:strand:+ start:1579 stop:2616 length:1038 start_codon:yes stop_codon:yes gene_type:complete
MAVNAQTIETYDNTVLREDLAEQYSMVSPEETPVMTSIGTSKAATQPHHEWSVVALAAPNRGNQVVEGDSNPAVDDGTLALRRGNYTMISDKRVMTSETSEASDAAAEDIQKIAKQVTLKIRELKRDMEGIILTNAAANIGATNVARRTAGLPAFLFSNTNTLPAGAVAPTLSSGTQGYPNAGWTSATTPAPINEDMFNTVIENCWTAGGNPTVAIVNSNNKRVISKTFTGSSTRYKDSIDKTLINAIDVYDSDFGQLSIVPDRFMPTLNADTTVPGNNAGANTDYPVLLLDTDFASLSFLQTMRQKKLAETGHAKDRLVWCEYAVQVDNEAAHGIYVGTNGAAA